MASRLIFYYSLLLVVLGAVFLTFTVLSFRYYARQTVTGVLRTRASEIMNIAQTYLDRPAQLSGAIERRFSPESEGRFIRITNAQEVLYQSPAPLEGHFNPVTVPPVSAGSPLIFGDLLLVSRSFPAPDGRRIVVETGQPYIFARIIEAQLARSLFVGLPILLLFAGLSGYAVMRQAQRPIEDMINAAEAYTFNDPHRRLPTVRSDSRIEALSTALNRMLDRLDNGYSHVSRFSADAAHELRTPLTIIRGELELVGATEKLPIEVSDAVSNALEEMTRLSGIVDSLITISRMDSMWGKRVHAAVDLEELVTETIDQMNLLAVEKRIQLSCFCQSSVAVLGDRDRLKQVLVNLLDNAIKYTREGGQVFVEGKTENDKGIITIADTGIGIAPAFHGRVFDRFFRVTPDRGEVGAGLGLAIVKSICNAHGGSVTLRSALGLGSCFIVELPLSKRVLADAGATPQSAECSSER